MSTPESDLQTEALKSIATTLKGIQHALDQLTGAVEGVAESIEKAHEPEGDLGVHLVGALKDLTSALHKRAQQERSHQPPQGRRDDRQQRHQENRERNHNNRQQPDPDENAPRDREPEENTDTPAQPSPEKSEQQPKQGGRGKGRGRRGGKSPSKPAPKG